MDKHGNLKPVFIVMAVSLIIAYFWDSLPYIKEFVHAILDPSAGVLLNLDKLWGMVIIVLIITIFMTLVQKYATDQKELKQIKEDQKELQKEIQKYKEHPEKMMELQKKQLEFIPKTFRLTLRPIIFTGIPLIIFFRWFGDYFAQFPDYKFLGLMPWIVFYILVSIVFSIILRKIFKVY